MIYVVGDFENTTYAQRCLFRVVFTKNKQERDMSGLLFPKQIYHESMD
jgi:hypothetical protein